MSENRKYYYMKLKENFFTDAKMVILESMQDGLLYSNLLLKMYLMSLKYNGILMLNDHLPHTPQTIATFTRHQIGTVERAIKVFLEFGFVEILTDGSYYMADIQLLIGQSSTEGERKRKERMRLKRQNLLPSGQVDKCPPEIRDKRLDIRDKSIEKEIEEVPNGTSCAEPEKSDSTRPIISLILNDKSFFNVTDEDVAKWNELYPAVDVMQELRKMAGWCESNTTKRKTRRGVRAFITSWLARAQDRGGSQNNYCHPRPTLKDSTPLDYGSPEDFYK